MIKNLFLTIVLLTATSASGEPATIASPLADSGITSISKLFEVIIAGVTYIAIPIIVLAFMYAGFKFVAAGGKSEDISKAKNIFLYTLAGSAIILGSNVILEVVVNTTNSFMDY